MNGVLVIDKPAGPTSHDVVAAIRKALNEKKVGHTGTLDPAATGVLPLVLGHATKLARYLSGGSKTYHATVRLGVTTETLDAEGTVVSERPVSVTQQQVAEALGGFVGDVQQLPPMYSAKKVGGKKLYELARQGVEVQREPKAVTISAIELERCELPHVTFTVRCSAGTYVRVLASDLGDKLGCGGHLQKLRRLAAGPFTLDDAISLDDAVADPEAARARALSVPRALADMASIDVPDDLGRMVVAGYQLTVADLRTLDVPNLALDDVAVLRSDSGNVLAVCRAMVATGEFGTKRRDERALKTECVLAGRR